MARILFVFPVPWSDGPKRPLKSFMEAGPGISYISALLRAHGHQTDVVVVSHNFMKLGRDLLSQTAVKFKPDVVGFSATAPCFKDAVDLAQWLRGQIPQLYMIAGGPHISLNPEAALAAGFDAACVGEGEYPMLELVQQLGEGKHPTGIKSLWFRNGSDIEKNPTRPFLENLDSLPNADYAIWNKWIDPKGLALRVKDKSPTASVLLGRGCPFSCTYCSNHALRTLASGAYVRVRSPEAIIAEIRSFSDLHPDLRCLYLEIETIAAKMEWALSLFERLKALNAERSSPLAFGCNLRVFPKLDPDAIFPAMKEANFKFINIGLESGSERVRKEILNREYSNVDVLRTVQSARRQGLGVRFYNLIGLPGETFEDFMETVQMNRLCAPDHTLTSIFEPYPGTDLYRVCQEGGFLNAAGPAAGNRSNAQLDFPSFPRAKIQYCYNWFDYYILKGRISNTQLFIRMASPWIHSSFFYRMLSRWKPVVDLLHAVKSGLTKSQRSQ